MRLTKSIERLSGGSFQMKLFEPGALIPANEGFDATSKGSVVAAWSTAGYDTGKYPALAFFTAVKRKAAPRLCMSWTSAVCPLLSSSLQQQSDLAAARDDLST